MVSLYEVLGGKCKRKGDWHSMFEAKAGVPNVKQYSADSLSPRFVEIAAERYLSLGKELYVLPSLSKQCCLATDRNNNKGMSNVVTGENDRDYEGLLTAWEPERTSIQEKLDVGQDTCHVKQGKLPEYVVEAIDLAAEKEAMWKNRDALAQVNTQAIRDDGQLKKELNTEGQSMEVSGSGGRAMKIQIAELFAKIQGK